MINCLKMVQLSPEQRFFFKKESSLNSLQNCLSWFLFFVFLFVQQMFLNCLQFLKIRIYTNLQKTPKLFQCLLMSKQNCYNKRFNLFQKIHGYLNDFENSKPFVITGPSGSGKSTLMANIEKKVIIFQSFFLSFFQ